MITSLSNLCPKCSKSVDETELMSIGSCGCKFCKQCCKNIVLASTENRIVLLEFEKSKFCCNI